MGNVLHEIDLPPAFGNVDWNGALAAPTLADIDGDGELEVVLNTVHSGFVAYDLPGTSNARVLWGTGRGSYLREGGNGGLPPVVTGPDLAVTWSQLTIAGPDRKGLYKINGSITVTNQGNTPSVPCIMYVYYPDELQMILKKPLKVKKIKAGYGITRKFVVRGFPLVTGSASPFTAVVDTGNAVIEINEGNNEAVYTINVP
jgi:hypothetical protein